MNLPGQPRYRFRLFLLALCLLLGSFTLLSRLHDLQIKQRDKIRKRIPGPTTVTVREPGIRGLITDRTGKTILADNSINYEITLNLEEIHQAYKQAHGKSRSGRIVRSGRDSSPAKEKEKEPDIVAIVEEWVRPRLKAHGIMEGFNKSALRVHFITHKGLVPYTYPADLSRDQFARLAEHNLDLPGLYISVRPRRLYPYGTLACHVLGYLKLWEKGSIPPGEQKLRYDHYLGDDRGIAGVEASMDRQLRGLPGIRTLIKNEKGHVIGLQNQDPPGQGARIELTIDARLQHSVENILRAAGRAAAVVLDPRNGEVLAMASIPNYDPNDFIPSISPKEFEIYNTNKAHPLVNRCISQYMPGSIFKLPTAIAGCLHGKAGHRHSCRDGIAYGRKGTMIRCWKTSGHGTLSLDSAVQRSCNPYFMSLANALGSRTLASSFEFLGLGKRTGIRLPNEFPGTVPGSLHWRNNLRPGQTMTPALTALSAIGQGDSEATPLQIASLTATIANGGRCYKPRLIRKTDHPVTGVILEKPLLIRDLLREGLKPADLGIIRRGMFLAASKAGGTALRVALKDIPVAAKTGTVQTGPREKRRRNAWTTAFAPYDSPRYVVTVYVEEGQSGGKVAGSLVHQIFRALFAAENGVRLPLAQMNRYQGHFNIIEEIKLPEGSSHSIATQSANDAGDESAELPDDASPVPPSSSSSAPERIPLPSITPAADSE